MVIASFLLFLRITAMSSCTLRLSRNSPIRTILVDEATGDAIYQIDTTELAQSVTRIRKFDPPTQPPLHWDGRRRSDSGEDITHKKRSKSKEEEGEAGEPPGTSDEMARIYWTGPGLLSGKMVFQGVITSWTEFLQTTGKLRG